MPTVAKIQDPVIPLQTWKPRYYVRCRTPKRFITKKRFDTIKGWTIHYTTPDNDQERVVTLATFRGWILTNNATLEKLH